ncbi:alpha/beta hydrolase [bacterium]|nr:alpha/beta hydrolase [bacterium]
MKRLCFALLIALCVASLASCQPPAGQAPPRQFQPPEDLEYKPDVVFATVNGRDLHMTLVYPKQPPSVPMPVVVWVHGGAWRAGSYKGAGQLIGLARQGYFCASIEYRLSQEAIFPAQIEDCKGALRFLRAHAQEYRLNPDKIGVWGGSAGGHLVALLGTSGGVKELEGDVGGNLEQSSAVQCVVDFFGPSDMTTMIADRGARILVDQATGLTPEEALIGGKTEEHLEVAKAASPVTYVDKSDPPFLIVHGEVDKTVPIKQSERLDEALRAAGVDCTFIRVKNGGHGFGPNCDPSAQQINQMVMEFLNKHLK